MSTSTPPPPHTRPTLTRPALTRPALTRCARTGRRFAMTIGLVAVLGALVGRTKQRHLMRRFDGATATEAHEAILSYATRRTGDPVRAAAIADRVVDRLQSRGVLAPAATDTAA